jgi:hypothetical protein
MTCPDQHILAKCFCTGARPVMCLYWENGADAAKIQKELRLPLQGIFVRLLIMI